MVWPPNFTASHVSDNALCWPNKATRNIYSSSAIGVACLLPRELCEGKTTYKRQPMDEKASLGG